jgi:hypothetical protein
MMVKRASNTPRRLLQRDTRRRHPTGEVGAGRNGSEADARVALV